MAAMVCPNCQCTNPHGTVFCQNCFGVLVETADIAKTQTLSYKQPRFGAVVDRGLIQRKRNAEPQIILKKHSVALYIDTELTPIVVLLTKQVILGRGAAR